MTARGEDALTFIAYPSSRYYDGRGANKPWLQELPDSITQAVWDSWLEIHPETAERLGIAEGEPADDYLPAWDHRGECLFLRWGCGVTR